MCLLRPVAAWGSLGSLGFVLFVRVRHVGRWCFFRIRLVRLGAPWGSLGSVVFVCLVQQHP